MTTPSHSLSNPSTNTKANILVVDDEVFNRILLVRVFSQTAIVHEAATGQEALNIVQERAIDIVLLDIMMPGMTGLDVLRSLRENPQTYDLPVILISALDDNADIVTGLQIGANDYMPKPFDLDVINARVSTQLKLKHMMDVHKQSIARLEEAQQMKDRLFSIASHDIKSPLSNVRFAEELLRQIVGTEDPTVEKILDTLKMTVSTMTHVVEEFLEMSLVQNGHMEFVLSEVDLPMLIKGLVEQQTPTAREKHIELIVSNLAETIQADAERLKQALGNFISNAIKYSPLNTAVTIYSQASENSIRICVADQGPGIPAQERDKLFKEFSKLSTRPTAGEHSTGLGLWIVKQMIELQGGRVGVDCPPDGGSIFWLELPIS